MDRAHWYGDARDWFGPAHFGLFVHWGLYAIPGWHEQHVYRKHLTRDEYTPLLKRFNPTRFDPDVWLDHATAAGMRYVCFTTKHIDGFCLWDSDLTAFKVTNTPYRRDTLRLLADACHRRNIPLCLYYSVVDNHQANYPHAGRPYEYPGPQPGDEPDAERYREYLTGQVRELCTRYGPIHGFWWDANVLQLHDPSVHAMIRELQPACVINNRGLDTGDFDTPERDWDSSVHRDQAFERPVEASQAIGYQSWGWRRDEDYYSDAHLLGSIQNILAKGGNYLLNVGPRANGTFPREAIQRLKRLGAWFDRVGEAFNAPPANHLLSEHSVLLTQRGSTLYVHLHRQPTTDAVYLHPIVDRPRRAVVLNTGRPAQVDVLDLPWLHNAEPNRALRVSKLPVNRQSVVGWVIQLDFDRPPMGHQVVATADTDQGVVGKA